MNELEKIRELIESRTAENNFLALTLLRKVCGYSFEAAFDELKFREESYDVLSIEIGDLRLEYLMELFSAIDVPPHWGYVYRAIYKGGTRQMAHDCNYYIDEWDAWRLGQKDGDDMIDIDWIKNDRETAKIICKKLLADEMD